MEGHLGAALFTRRAAGRTATPKVALGDTNFELAQDPVNPRRERMDDPQFQTDDARDFEPHAVQGSGGPGGARLFRRQALVHMHTTPPKGAPRLDQRTHLDEEFKAEMDAEKDPDLIRHTTGKSAADVPLLEALAALEHQQWVEWSKDIASSEDLSDERVDRWEEAWVAYSALSDEEKEKDRVYARKVIKLLEKKGIPLQKSKEAGRLFS